MGGYKDRTIRLDFAELGKGCYVVIKNPALQPLEPGVRIPEGLTPAEQDEFALQRSYDRVAALITEWVMWDVTQDEEVPLALPSTEPTVLQRCPGVVLNRIGKEIQARTNP